MYDMHWYPIVAMIWLWNLEKITNNAQRESITAYLIDGCQDLINI